MALPRAGIEFDDYKVKAFLDSNIILECRPLADLPWHEIDADGPIIALMTPTAIKEVDSKKQDGRIGKHARAFNRLIGRVAVGGAPLVIRESGPRVELALSRAARIPWDKHDDLDPDDGDCRIIAEALHARDMSDSGKMMVSHDIKPLSLAAGNDMQALHVSDDWLRQAEPTPADKEVQRLKGRLAEYQATEPEFEIGIEMLDGEPVRVVRIEDLTDDERSHIERSIVASSPEHDQVRGHYGILSGIGEYDHSYADRYKAYRRKVPIFLRDYSQRLERLFNQARVRVRVANKGKMQAENLLVEVTVSSGWLHDRYVLVSPQGPTAPKPRTNFLRSFPLSREDLIQPYVGRHEFAFKDWPKWRSWFSVTCEDFRHGADWTFDGILGLDPRSSPPTIAVDVTASNFRGSAKMHKEIDRTLTASHVSSFVDMDILKFIVPTPLDRLSWNEREEMIDERAFSLDGEDDY